jgi:hypothetical protein
MKVYKLNDIRAALEDRQILVVAERTGIHSNTLYKIMNQPHKSISLETYHKLVAYLFTKDGE